MASVKDLKRMCISHVGCEKCPLCIEGVAHCKPFYFPSNVGEVIDKWVQEHPAKTYAMDFLEKFPDAPIDSNGVPKCCWKYVYGDGTYCSSNDCTKCWNRELE